MENMPPVSQHRIAGKLGLSQATVSMALAGNPRVAEGTRNRVAAIAAEMQYHPDPGLRALGRYRRAVRAPSYHATLGWVHNLDSPDWWHQSAVFRVVFDAAQKRAQRLGYQLENFWINRKEMTPKRSTEILHSRGIDGLLLLPTFDYAPKIELDWSHFSAVRIADYLQGDSVMHLVGADQYAALRNVLARVGGLGYGRPGLVTSSRLEHCLLAQYSSAYLGVSHTVSECPWPKIYCVDTFDAPGFARWLKHEKPDVLVMAYISESLPKIMDTLARIPLRVPEDIGIAMACLPDQTFQKGLPDFSGVDEGFAHIGERAVELLVGLCENFERGLPEMPIRHLLSGAWHEGKTLREQAPAALRKKPGTRGGASRSVRR